MVLIEYKIIYFRDDIVVEQYLEFTDATPVKDLKILCNINQRISPRTVIWVIMLPYYFCTKCLKTSWFWKSERNKKSFQTITDHFYSFKENNLTCFNNSFLCFFSTWEGGVWFFSVKWKRFLFSCHSPFELKSVFWNFNIVSAYVLNIRESWPFFCF